MAVYHEDRYWLIVPSDRTKPRIVSGYYYSSNLKRKPGERLYKLIIKTPRVPDTIDEILVELPATSTTPEAAVEEVPA